MDKKIFFTINGTIIEKEFVNVEIERLTPIIGLKQVDTQVQFNFGLTPFVFKIREHASFLLKKLYRFSGNHQKSEFAAAHQ